MYVRGGLKVRHLMNDSWRFMLVVALWAALVVYVHDVLGYQMLGFPMTPVSTIGIAVSLYLGFKSKSAYDRWWEARKIWGAIVNDSRNWTTQVYSLIYSPDKELDPKVYEELVMRHIAWINALAHQLRRKTRLKPSSTIRIFDHQCVESSEKFHQLPESYLKYLSSEEAVEFSTKVNPSTHIAKKQGMRLQELARDGFLDDIRHAQLVDILGKLYDWQGKCERIKNTPFPRQVANFGVVFTWIFIFLLPLAFVDLFEAETKLHHLTGLLEHEYMFTLVPFTLLISWVFFIMEKVSDSTEDPFEGGVTDVSISTLCRNIEIDLKEMMDFDEIPKPLEPVEGVLY